MHKRNLLQHLKAKVLAASLLVLGLSIAGRVAAQQVSIATGLPSSASSGSSTAPSVITFCINNSRSSAVTLKGIDHYMSTSNNNTIWKLYYSATSLSGTPNVTTWTFIDSVAGPASISGTGIYGLFSGLNFSIPASTTYRFALQTAASIINYGGATTTPNSQTSAGISLYRGDYQISSANVGYAGSASAPPFSPRFFCGTVYLDTGLAICAGTPSAAVITTAAMTTAAPLCSGGTKALAASYSFVNGISYQWQSASSSTGTYTNVTNGTGATTLNYTTGPVTSNTFYRVGVTCSVSNITTYSAPYQVLVGAPQPSAISGSPTFCPGNASTYSVTNVSGTTYAWTLPTGWSGSSTSSSITTTPSSSSGTISVIATSSCGTSIPRTFAVAPGSAPATPASINGLASACVNSSQTYSVAPVAGAVSYTWTLPSGWSGSSTTNSINVIMPGTAGSGTISVKAVNGCGTSSNANLAVTVISSLATPGNITSSLPAGNTYCSGQLYNFSINPVPGATAYTWTLPSGWSGTVTGTTIQAFPDTTSGQVKVTAYASCATSATKTLNVTVANSVNPSVSVAAPAGLICQGVATVLTATPTNGGTLPTYVWRKNGVVVTGSGSTYTDYTLVNGDQITVKMASNAACRTADTVTSNTLSANITPSVTPGISINSVPTITVCQGTMITLTTTNTGGGSNPTYQWYSNGVPVIGANSNSYSSSSAANGDTITVQMTSTAVCAKFTVATSNKVGLKVNDIVSPTISATATSTTPIPGVDITFTATQSGGGATPVYAWFLNNVEIPNASSDTYTTSNLKNGDRIAVRMLSYDPCAKPALVFSNEIIMGNTTGIANVGNWDGIISLYPNPSSGRFTIASEWKGGHSGNMISIDVINVLGQSVYHGELNPNKIQAQGQWHYGVQLDDRVSSGRYMVRLSSTDGMSTSLPLMVNR